MKLRQWSLAAGLALAAWGHHAWAQEAAITVEGAWARASVAGQKATGAFMRLTARESTSLVRVQSPVAGVAEVHEMKMVGDVMKMRAIPALELPAGQTVELRPGGYHLMLMDLKESLGKGANVPVTLVFRDAQGAETTLSLSVPVSLQPPAGAASGGHKGGHGAH